MNPRLKSSKKWTAFPKEYLSQIEEVFAQGFKPQLGSSKLVIEGRIYSEEILLRVGLSEKGRLKQSNFEVSMNYSAKSKDTVERLHDCIDAAASMMQEYFESVKKEEEVDFPLTWKEYEFNERPLFLQYTTTNSELESKANELLGEAADSLLVEEPETEDALDEASEIIESDEVPQGPTMFSAKKKKKSDPLH